MLQKPNLCRYTNGYTERERNMRTENCKSWNGVELKWVTEKRQCRSIPSSPSSSRRNGKRENPILEGKCCEEEEEGKFTESKEWVAWFLSCCCCCCCCCCSPQISSSNLAETATHNAQSVKTESNTVKMKEEVKPSSNEWVTFIVFIRLFLHLRSLLQAREIRNPQSATPKWSSKIGNGN
jgi:hypothetical protein